MTTSLHTMKRFALLLLAVLALAAAGCGGDDNNDSGRSSNAQPAPAQGGSEGNASSAEDNGGGEAAKGKEVEVEMRDFAFSPSSVTVKVGQTVKWENYDDAPHNAIGDGIKTETINKGEETTFKATKAGTFNYICTIHPNMKGTITVTS